MATKALHALEYLDRPEKNPPRPVCVVYGDEPFLRRQAILKLREAVLGGEEGDFSFSAVDGDKAEWRDVLENLSTVAMFGGGQRLVLVEEADDFVTRYRGELEGYVAKPSRTGVLALELASFPSNTRLYKSVAAEGLVIDCSTPAPAKLTKWLVDWAKKFHRTNLAPAAANELVEIIGPELGLLDQEIAKLALAAGGESIEPRMVKQYVGGWRAKTTWEMLDLALDGKVREAMLQLDRLLSSGEQPIGILAQISASLRRFAAATRLMLLAEAAGRRTALPDALQRAGMKPFVLQKSAIQLRRLGRGRGAKLYEWLLEADLDLKGDSAMPPRLILERLIVRLAAPA
ncbi:MAG: DNA polymerase III subunit delta [Pirellulales bacterium]|nr:DNA polymerase III subunit delta [Pirellulales bacterium]